MICVLGLVILAVCLFGIYFLFPNSARAFWKKLQMLLTTGPQRVDGRGSGNKKSKHPAIKLLFIASLVATPCGIAAMLKGGGRQIADRTRQEFIPHEPGPQALSAQLCQQLSRGLIQVTSYEADIFPGAQVELDIRVTLGLKVSAELSQVEIRPLDGGEFTRIPVVGVGTHGDKWGNTITPTFLEKGSCRIRAVVQVPDGFPPTTQAELRLKICGVYAERVPGGFTNLGFEETVHVKTGRRQEHKR